MGLGNHKLQNAREEEEDGPKAETEITTLRLSVIWVSPNAGSFHFGP